MIEMYRPKNVTHDFGDLDLDLQGHTGLQTTKIFSSPVGSLCHTCGVVRRTSCVVCVYHNYEK